MAMTLGTRGEDGKNLVRDMSKFKKNLDDVDFTGADKGKLKSTKGGKKTYVYK